MNQASAKRINEDMAARYLDPTNDIAFKKVFGTEEHKPLLISFLNSILRLKPQEFIESLDFLPQEESPMLENGKRVIFDIKCRDKMGREFIVEMQNQKIPEFVKRSQYYTSHTYVSQIGKGTEYFNLKPVVLVAISNFELFNDDDDPISFHQTLNIKTQQNHLKDLSYVFVELHKFKKSQEEVSSLEEQWLFFLKHAHDIAEIPKSTVSKEIVAAYNSLEQFAWNEAEYDAYVRASISLTDDFRAKEARYKEGREKGREEGRAEEKKVTALKMLEQGLSIDSIIGITGLSETAINKLQKTL